MKADLRYQPGSKGRWHNGHGEQRTHLSMALKDVIEKAPASHRIALQWFADQAGLEVPWQKLLADGTRLFSTPKGIYKPAGSPYALSVRQTLVSEYSDREPIERPDGTWTYIYHQEGDDERYFTNAGLLACIRDQIPVGIARQTRSKPNARYKVLGVARVTRWKDGFFQFDGFSPDGSVSKEITDGPFFSEIEHQEQQQAQQGAFDPSSLQDEREKALREIVRRRGQQRFRALLLRIYGGRCAISGCSVESVLEAAHVTPYLGPDTNKPGNGVLLRADIHTLWDLGLIAIHPETWEVRLNESLVGTEYAQFQNRRVFLPVQSDDRPASAALKAQWVAAGFIL